MNEIFYKNNENVSNLFKNETLPSLYFRSAKIKRNTTFLVNLSQFSTVNCDTKKCKVMCISSFVLLSNEKANFSIVNLQSVLNLLSLFF